MFERLRIQRSGQLHRQRVKRPRSASLVLLSLSALLVLHGVCLSSSDWPQYMHDGVMYFTGGGSGRNSRGETLAVEPHTGRVLWRTTRAYASGTGTPSIVGRQLILPGAYRRPLAPGYAVAATDRGIFFTDTRTGHVVHQTPAFASQTCPHPAFANGRMFYAPQDNGMIYCFEPAPDRR